MKFSLSKNDRKRRRIGSVAKKYNIVIIQEIVADYEEYQIVVV